MAANTHWQGAFRQRITRRRVLGTFAVGGAAFVAACGGDSDDDSGAGGQGAQATASGPAPAGAQAQASGTPQDAVRGGTLRTGTFLNVLGIDPHIEVSVGLNTAQRVYTYLGGFNSVGQTFTPLAAQGVEQPDPTQFVFKLRQGVKFQNIDPVPARDLTAQDVLYSMERFRDHPRAQNNDFFKAITDKMEAIDPTTFRLSTKGPYAESLSEIGGVQKAIVPREAVEKFGDLSNNAIGAGPYILQEYVKGERTVLRKNPDYYDKNLPYLDGMRSVTILDMNTLVQAYKSDQLDINGALLTKLDYDDLRRNDKLVTEKMPALHYGSLGLNVSKKPFDDKRVREAMWVGVDRAQFVDKVGLGEGVPMGPLSAGLDFWVLPEDQLKPYLGPDVKKAKDLLSAAGYANGFKMTIDTSNGVQLFIDHAELLVAELKKLGIEAELRLTDLPTFLSDKLFKGDFDAVVFTHNPYESPKIPLGFYHKNGIGGFSWFSYSSPQVTAAIDAQSVEIDVNKRKSLVQSAQKAILDDGGPMINFFSPTLFTSYNKRLGGYDPLLRGGQGWRYTEFVKQS